MEHEHYNPNQEQELLEAWRTGDREALSSLWDLYHADIVKLTKRWARSLNKDAEDVESELFLKLKNGAKSWQPDSKGAFLEHMKNAWNWVRINMINEDQKHGRAVSIESQDSMTHEPANQIQGRENNPRSFSLSTKKSKDGVPSASEIANLLKQLQGFQPKALQKINGNELKQIYYRGNPELRAALEQTLFQWFHHPQDESEVYLDKFYDLVRDGLRSATLWERIRKCLCDGYRSVAERLLLLISWELEQIAAEWRVMEALEEQEPNFGQILHELLELDRLPLADCVNYERCLATCKRLLMIRLTDMLQTTRGRKESAQMKEFISVLAGKVGVNIELNDLENALNKLSKKNPLWERLLYETIYLGRTPDELVTLLNLDNAAKVIRLRNKAISALAEFMQIEPLRR